MWHFLKEASHYDILYVLGWERKILAYGQATQNLQLNRILMAIILLNVFKSMPEENVFTT